MKGKILNSQEVQAILNGSKMMFREMIKNKTSFGDFLQTREAGDNWYKDRTISIRGERGLWADYTLERFVEKFCPYQIGQEIFCKESFFKELHPDSLQATGKIYYAATCGEEVIKVDGDGWQLFRKNGDPASPWRPAQHMKQEHSRLTLEITDVKVERLREISEDDCKKEGIGYTGGWNGEDYDNGEYYFGKLEETKDGMNWENEMFEYPDLAFAELWNATHKKPEEKFEANPFVWVVDFKINN